MSTAPKRKIEVRWTQAALDCMKALPPKVRRGLFEKAGELAGSSDPRDSHKPLTGALAGYYRITYSRFRAIFRVDEQKLPGGQLLIVVTVTFVAAGKREEHSRDDVYKVAEKLVAMGLIDVEGDAPKGGKQPQAPKSRTHHGKRRQ